MIIRNERLDVEPRNAHPRVKGVNCLRAQSEYKRVLLPYLACTYISDPCARSRIPPPSSSQQNVVLAAAQARSLKNPRPPQPKLSCAAPHLGPSPHFIPVPCTQTTPQFSYPRSALDHATRLGGPHLRHVPGSELLPLHPTRFPQSTVNETSSWNTLPDQTSRRPLYPKKSPPIPYPL